MMKKSVIIFVTAAVLSVGITVYGGNHCGGQGHR